MLLMFLIFIRPISSTLRGIMQDDIKQTTQQRVNNMILDIAKYRIWRFELCRNDMLFYEFKEEHIFHIKNMFPNRLLSYTEDGYCKYLYIK